MKLSKFKSETGAMAIEAVLGLTFFMLAIISVMMMSLIIRLQATMQYAVDQTAKQLSSYYYLLDAAGIAKYTSGNSDDDTKQAVKPTEKAISDTNEIINNVIDFAGEAGNASKDFTNLSVSDFENLKDDAVQMKSKAQELWQDVKALKDDPKGQMKAVITIFARSLGNKALSYYVTPYLCRMIMPNYISGDLKSTEKYLDNIGVIGDDGQTGMDMIDFTKSSLLADGRTIKIVAIYRLNTKKLTFGMIDTDLVFQQSAVTAAWVEPNESGSLQSIGGAYKNNNKKASEGEE